MAMTIDIQKLEDALKNIQYAIIDLEDVDPRLFEQYALLTPYVDIADDLQDVADDVREIYSRLDGLAWALDELIEKLRRLEGEGETD